MAYATALSILHADVPDAWLDHNRHMNVASYVTAFDEAMEAFLDSMGIGKSYKDALGGAVFVVENHISYQREVLVGQRVSVNLQVLDLDDKRMHLFLRMWNETRGMQAATSEILAIHVDMQTRRASPFPAASHDHLAKLVEVHRHLPKPVEAGKRITIRGPGL